MIPDNTTTTVSVSNGTTVNESVTAVAANASQDGIARLVNDLGLVSLAFVLSVVMIVVVSLSTNPGTAQDYRGRITTLFNSTSGHRCVVCGRDLGSEEQRTDGAVRECPDCHRNPYALSSVVRDPAGVVTTDRCAHCWYDLSETPTTVTADDYCPMCGRHPDTVVAALTDTRCINGHNIERFQRENDGPLSHCPKCGEYPY